MSEQASEEAARPSGKPKRPAKQKKVERSPVELATMKFAACGRCSYFWAGSQVLVGAEQAAAAVEQRQGGWISLPWNQAMSNLIHKSYGVLVDSDFFHYESCCPECRRTFAVQLRQPLTTNEEDLTAAATLPALPPPPAIIIDLAKYDSLDNPGAGLPPAAPNEGLYVLRVQLHIQPPQ